MIIETLTDEADELIDGYLPLSSGLLVPERFVKKPTAFDFFAGCGGMGCGLKQGGFDIIGALEFDCGAAHTYMVNLCSHPVQIYYTSEVYRKKMCDYFERHFKKLTSSGKTITEFDISGSGWISNATDENGLPYPGTKTFFFGDIRETTGKSISSALGIEIGEIDLVAGGPPCQGFSTAGKRQIMDPRNSLVFEYARLICELQPKTFMMENVPGIISMVTPEGVNVIDQFMRILEDGNYISYEAAKKVMGIAEKDLGIKPKYFVKQNQKNLRINKKVKKGKVKQRSKHVPYEQPNLFM